MTEATHTLYRFFDAAGQLLYVGRTISPSTRWRTHERKAPWYPDVASVTRKVYTSAEAVDAAERAAISTERPIHNIVGNPSRTAPTPSRPLVAADADTFLIRLAAMPENAEVVASGECLGDETVCECRNCHGRRAMQLEEARSKYDWHPDLLAEIETVEAMYCAGVPLTNWYYDLFDVEMFARMRLHAESAANPIPAYMELEGSVAVVECPLCFNSHRHFLAPDTILDRPFAAGCRRPGALYVFEEDWPLLRDRLFSWGEASSRRAAVA